MSGTTRKDDELRMEIIRKTSTRMSLSDVDIVMQIVRQYGVQERIDELDTMERLLKTQPLDSLVSASKERIMLDWIEDKRSIYTALKDKQETKQ